jgi:hypothetical protein
VATDDDLGSQTQVGLDINYWLTSRVALNTGVSYQNSNHTDIVDVRLGVAFQY